VLGPILITSLREREVARACHEMVLDINATDFTEAFGAGTDQLDTLISHRIVTIPKLLRLLPDDYPGITHSLFLVVVSPISMLVSNSITLLVTYLPSSLFFRFFDVSLNLASILHRLTSQIRHRLSTIPLSTQWLD
jgi:hypothetical protein